MTSDILPAAASQGDWAFLDVLPVAVYVCAQDGAIVKYNRRAVELWGREPDLSCGTERFCGSYKIFLPDGRYVPHDQCPMTEVLRTGVRVEGLEAVLERPDGTRVSCLVNIDPLRDASGRITGAVNCLQDITAPRRAAEEMREQRERLNAIVETTPACIKLVARDGTLLHMNPAGLHMVEAGQAAEVEGRSTLDLIAPEHRERWQRHHLRVCDGERVSWSFDIIGLAGTRRHMETHAAPLRLSDGTTAQLAITRDVTEQRRVAEALRDSERRLRDLLEALPIAVYTTDAAGRITFYNEAAAHLAGRRPHLGEDQWCVTWKLYHPDGTPLPHDQCPMAIALKENRPVRGVEAMAQRPDGTLVPFVPYPTPLRDRHGKLIGAVNMLVDATRQKAHEAELMRLNDTLEQRVWERTQELLSETEQRRKVEAQLHQAQKMEAIGQLTGGVAHDFNNLLTAIISNVELIESKAKEERIRRYGAAAKRAAHRGAKLTDQLLAFSRKQYLQPESTDINELVAGMGEMLPRTLGGNIRIEMALAPGLWPALIDASQIESAVLNLAINSRDAMPEGGTLRIETANLRVGKLNSVGDLAPGDYVMIAVTDSGCGMTEEVKAKAFDPFYTTKKGKSSGLGLSQVYGTAIQSGGGAEIESAVGTGTTVRLYLPRSQAESTAPAVETQVAPSVSPIDRARVLVIDDDDDVREVIVEYLRELGYGAVDASSAKEGMDLLANSHFDAIVLDYAMPGMNGAQAAKTIRSCTPAVPILFVTGYADAPGLGDKVLRSAVLRKPFPAAKLDATLRTLIDASGAAANVVPLRSA